MLEWNSEEKEVDGRQAKACADGVKRSEVPCATTRHDGVVEVLWRFRYAGQARSAVRQSATAIPVNFGQ